jgi:hypothetical protein
MTGTLASASHPSSGNPGLPARASSGPWGSLPALLALIVLLLAGCDTQSEDPDNQTDSFFPLRVGQEWTYELTESDVDTNILPWPLRTTVSVLGDRTIAGKRYFLLHNYFIPGPNLPDTILVRNEGSRVFIRRFAHDDADLFDYFAPDEEAYLFYSFAPTDTALTIPMYVNPEWIVPYFGFQVDFTDTSAAVHWFDTRYQRYPSQWQETFERGAGRTQIVSTSQAYGRVEWRLVQID